jgi:hypothetical protein
MVDKLFDFCKQLGTVHIDLFFVFTSSENLADIDYDKIAFMNAMCCLVSQACQ